MTLTAGQQAWVGEQLGKDAQTAPISGTNIASFDLGDDRVRFLVLGTDGELATHTATAPCNEEEMAERGAELSRLAEVEQAEQAAAAAERAAEEAVAADAAFADRMARLVGLPAAEIVATIQGAREAGLGGAV